MDETAPQIVNGAADFAARATHMVSTARMEVALLTQELDRRIYGTTAFADAMRHFVLQHPHTKVRILVNAAQSAVANSPRLVELGRSLTSFVEFRQVPPERQQVIREETLITDGRVMLYRETPSDLEAKYYDAAPSQARLKLKDFDVLWHEAQPAQELRKLGI